MAFWNRKKKKKKTESEPESPAAAMARAAAALGPVPPAPEAPLGLPVLDTAAPLVNLRALQTGTLSFEALAFRPVPVPGLVHPFVNPKQPDLFGTPNWVFQYFLEALRDASVTSVEDFEQLLVVWRGPDHPHFGFIYTEQQMVLPVWFESEQLVPWLSTLGGLSGGARDIEAKMTGYDNRKSTFSDQSDLADFVRANAPSAVKADVADDVGAMPAPVVAAVAPPAPPLEMPRASALVPPANLDPGASAIERDGLEPGGLSLDGLAFRRVGLPDLPAPFIDPDRPESFGEPNYALRTLIEHLRTAIGPVVDNLEVLVIHQRSRESPHVAFAYTRDRTILPVWFDGQLQAWLTASRGKSERAIELRVPPSGGYQSGSAVRDLSADLASFMVDSAPASWRGFDDMPAKQRLLDEALAANGRRADVDPTGVAETWRTLIEVTGAEPNPPANDVDIAEFETATDLTLPPELVAMLKVHNGATGAFGMMSMMSLDEILLEWRGWKQIFDEWPLDELLGNSSCPTGEALGIYTTPRWIPLVDERSGNFAALDLVPGAQGSVGQIIYFGAEESDSIRVLATDLGAFLGMQLEYAKAEILQNGEFNPQDSASFYMN